MENIFYMLKALFVLNTLTFLFWILGYAEKQIEDQAKSNFKICDVTEWITNNCNTRITNIWYIRK